MTLQQTINAWLPIVTVLLSSGLLIPLAVRGFGLLTQAAGSIGDTRLRALALEAVHLVEQTMATAPSALKKSTAVNFLQSHGIATGTADGLVEYAVHVMNTAAATVLAGTGTQAPPAGPDVRQVSVAVAADLQRIAGQVLAGPGPGPAPGLERSPTAAIGAVVTQGTTPAPSAQPAPCGASAAPSVPDAAHG